MSLPPPPPQGPPPGPPPGWGPGGHPSPPPYGPPPGRSAGATIALVIGGVALAALLLGVVGVGAFLIAGGGDDESAADTPATDPTSRHTTEPASEAPSPDAPSSSGGSTGPAPSTPYTPSDDTDDDIHNDVKVGEFPGDWDFRLGDVEHHATLVRSVDHASCAPVEDGNVLTKQRCEYAAQWVYNALGGKVRLTHLFLVFDTERHAKAAQASMKDTDLDLPADSIFASFVQGKWNSSVHGNVVAVTIGTSRAKVPEKRLTSLVNYMNTDFRSALLLRF